MRGFYGNEVAIQWLRLTGAHTITTSLTGRWASIGQDRCRSMFWRVTMPCRTREVGRLSTMNTTWSEYGDTRTHAISIFDDSVATYLSLGGDFFRNKQECWQSTVSPLKTSRRFNEDDSRVEHDSKQRQQSQLRQESQTIVGEPQTKPCAKVASGGSRQ